MSSTTTTILLVSQQLAIYLYSSIFILGLFGNIILVFIFTAVKIFRNNQTIFYLITMTINDCSLLIFALPFRWIDLAFGHDLTRLSLIWCKLRPMISHTLALISFSAICFATIDQYLSTNHQPWLKRLSTLKLAHRLIYTSIIIWIIYDCIFLIFFDSKPTTGCGIYNLEFSRYYSFVHYITLNGIIPIVVSSMFSLLAYWNVRRIVQLRMQIVRRRLDRQLTAMVLSKVAFLVLTILPSIIFRIYLLNITVNSNDYLRLAIHQLISNIAFALFYVNTAV